MVIDPADRMAPRLPAGIELDDARLIDRLQRDLPLTERPLADVGAELRLGEPEVIERLTRLLRTGDLKADDATHAIDRAAEDEVLDAIARADWSALHSDRALPDAATRQTMRRRWMFRPVDTIRAWMPVGDR